MRTILFTLFAISILSACDPKPEVAAAPPAGVYDCALSGRISVQGTTFDTTANAELVIDDMPYMNLHGDNVGGTEIFDRSAWWSDDVGAWHLSETVTFDGVEMTIVGANVELSGACVPRTASVTP